MPTFRYSALDPGGRKVAGVLSVSSQQAALAELESKNLRPIRVRQGAGGGLPSLARISRRRQALWYSELADLLRAGVPLLRGLRLLGSRKAGARLAAVYRQIADEVAQGQEMAKAMEGHPGVFSAVQIAMVRAGEKGGFLEDVLARLGAFMLAQAELRAKIVGSLVYPGVLVSVGCIILGVIFGVFVPRFRTLFESIPQLPAVTKFVFGVSEAVSTYGLVTAGVLALAIVGLWRASRNEGFRRRVSTWVTRSPMVGPVVRSMAAARFCRLLGTLLTNGVPMLSAMDIATRAAGNVLMEDAITEATEAVRQGQPLAKPLSESGLFSDDVAEMIAVAEQAATLDTVLVTIAETIEGRVDRLLNTLVKLIEPLMLVMLAGVVVVVAVGLILPMTQLSATGN